MTTARDREPTSPGDHSPEETDVRPETIEAHNRLESEPGPIRRALSTLTAPLRNKWVLLFAALAGSALWLSYYFRGAGDRVPITTYIDDASRTALAGATPTTETRPLTPAPELEPRP